jgi:hypothetical protein
MLCLSLAFFFAGKVESIVIDKKKQELQLWRTSVICTKSCRAFPLSEIVDIKAYKRGHSGVHIYTLHYKIMAEFRTLPAFKITETGKEEKCIRQVTINILNYDLRLV